LLKFSIGKESTISRLLFVLKTPVGLTVNYILK
jgi:hypothetical protein